MADVQGDADVDGLVTDPWFAKDNTQVLYYRVNRRPIGGEPGLFKPDPDLLSHLERALSSAGPVESGRKYKRAWRLGNLKFDRDGGSFTAQLGWARTSEALGRVWNDSTHEWTDRVVPKDDSAVAPIAFDLRTRVLGVLKHPSFSTETVISQVLTQALNDGEHAEDFPSTDWSVQPLGDNASFEQWLDSVDQLLVLRMIFKRPNPDAEPEFQKLFDRLDNFEAEEIKEEIRARDKERGLRKDQVRKDPDVRGHISAAMVAFGRIFASGRRNGKSVAYDQTKHGLRETLGYVGGDWDTATQEVLRAVERTGRDRVIREQDPE
ncbi:DUF4747 family protein [Curtobacterium flaccumfaciens]|uniref:DUF4747 family protein n=1 Tax=Curtobacterium flaccumfaciens TaxID=2035 RepID=UPI0026583F52|nr:DUF4747 family protein [Curtobacterium flaccumfaciens]MCS5519172.1 DUF4747 family protein [Curtobacterium flaccumfaciens]